MMTRLLRFARNDVVPDDGVLRMSTGCVYSTEHSSPPFITSHWTPMKRLIAPFHLFVKRLIVTCCIVTASLSVASAGADEFFVSRSGNDTWSGKLASPNSRNTDGPFRTLAGARDALRSLKGKGALSGGAIVNVRGGTYTMYDTFLLTADDSGTVSGPVIWRAYRGESVLLAGGRTIGNFARLTERAIRARLSPAARNHVLVADLKSQGITSYGEITQRGTPPMELFINGKRMTIARYPNQGWLHIADVPQSGDTLYNKGLDREKRYNGVPAGRHYGRIAYEGREPSHWASTGDVFVHGYWTFDWSDSYQAIQSIDTGRQEITLRPPHHWYGYTKNQRFYFLNVFEELDSPGEWYLDRSRGLLYVWPKEKISSAYVSILDKPIIALDSCSWTRIEGMTLAYGRRAGIRIRGGRDNTISGCVINNIGGDGAAIDGGTHHGIVSCNIHDVGLGGILLKGGDRRTLTPGGHYAEDDHIHDYSRWMRTGQYAVVMEGVGQRVAHTLIHDSPFEGIAIRGNDNIIEYNEFHHLMKETGDAGAIHTGRDWTWQGNVIRYNYFHDLKGPGLHGVMAVYLDDWASGFTVTGNLFYRAGRATMIGGGRDNVVMNNIYVECSPSLHVDARGLGWASYYFDGTTKELFTAMDNMNYKEPPYSSRYPNLLHMEDSTPAVPKYNTITGNISYGGRWMDVYDYLAFDLSVVTIKENVIGDPVLLRRRKDGEKGWDPYYLDIDMKEGYVALANGDTSAARTFGGNLIVKGNPGVRAPGKGDFRLIPNSAAANVGFTPVRTSEIGPRRKR